MDPQLHAMNGSKTSSSFTVKDILDLPKGKPSCSPVDSSTNTVNAASLNSIPSVPEVPDITSVGGYYDADNPYTRWLHTNENMNYSRKLNCSLHVYFKTKISSAVQLIYVKTDIQYMYSLWEL